MTSSRRDYNKLSTTPQKVTIYPFLVTSTKFSGESGKTESQVAMEQAQEIPMDKHLLTFAPPKDSSSLTPISNTTRDERQHGYHQAIECGMKSISFWSRKDFWLQPWTAKHTPAQTVVLTTIFSASERPRTKTRELNTLASRKAQIRRKLH